jgi:hypothetical protein
MAYLNETGLAHLWTHILAILGGKANTVHTHTKADITDLEESQSLIIEATDDNNGNVTLTTSYGEAISSDNTYLVVNN